MKVLGKIVVAGIASLVALVAAVAIYGSTQPREHQVARTVVLPQSPAEVFAIVSRPADYPCWRPEVSRIQILSHTPLRYVEHTDDGAVRYAVDEAVPDERLVVRIADDDLLYGGAWTFEVEPEGQGTALTITERGFVDNVVVRGMAAMLMDPSASIVAMQTALQSYRACQ